MSPINPSVPLTKRDGLAVPLPAIVGILSAIIVINTFLLIGFCILRNRRRIRREVQAELDGIASSRSSDTDQNSITKPEAAFFGPADVEKSKLNYAASQTRSLRKAPPQFSSEQQPEAYAVGLPGLPPPPPKQTQAAYLQLLAGPTPPRNEYAPDPKQFQETGASDLTDASFYPSELVGRSRLSTGLRRTRSAESISIYSQITVGPAADHTPNWSDGSAPPLPPPKRISQGYYHQPQPLDTISEGSHSQSSHRDRMLSEISFDTPVQLTAALSLTKPKAEQIFNPAFTFEQPRPGMRLPPKSAHPMVPPFVVPTYVEPLNVRKSGRRRSLDDARGPQPFRINVRVGEIVPAPLSAPMLPPRHPLRSSPDSSPPMPANKPIV